MKQNRLKIPGKKEIFYNVERSGKGKYCLVVKIKWCFSLVFTGVHTSGWITTHGIALSCNNDLSWFELFTPCGIEGKGVTSLSKETNRDIEPQVTIPAFIESLQNVFDCTVVLEDSKDDRIDDSL